MRDEDKTRAQLLEELNALRQQQKTLAREEMRPSGVLHELPIMVCAFDPDFRLAYANPACARGTESLDLRASFLDLLPEESRAPLAEKLSALEPSSAECVHLHRVERHGEHRWERWTTRALFTSDGQLTGFHAHGLDITEQRTTEVALRDHQQKLDFSLEAGKIGLWSWIEGRVHWDEKICAIYERDSAPEGPEEFLGMLHPEDRSRMGGVIGHAIERGVYPESRHRVITPSGQLKWVLSRANVLTDADGNFKGLFGADIDVTEKTEAEIKLRDALQHVRKWETVFRFAGWGVVISRGVEPVIEVANAAFAKMVGRSQEELAGAHITEFCEGDDLARIQAMQQIAHRDGHVEFEANLIRKDGSRFPAAFDLSVVRDDHGQPLYRVINVQDITRRTSLEQQLRRSQKLEAVGTLAGGIAHDFNNILAIVLLNAEIAEADLPPSSPIRQHFSNIKRMTERGTGLVRQILTFSRMASTQLAPVDAVAVIREALQLIRATIPSHIELRVDLPADDLRPSILGDASQLHLILVNLCTNAHHAMEHGGTLSVSLADGHALPDGTPALALSVEDNGCGIPSEHLDKVFDPFFTTKDISRGTGLGLSVVHGIVEECGGEITVESTLEQGTRVTIILPRAPATPNTEPTPEPPTPEGAHLLVVEDEEDIAQWYQDFLEELGYRVTLCTTGDDALACFLSDPEGFDLVFTDQAIPHLSGLRLSQSILAIRPEIPIIICTGYGNDAIRDEALSLGVRAILIKPISLHLVQRAIAKHLAG